MLRQLSTGATVRVQTRNSFHSRWDRVGTVVEVMANRKYLIRLHGSGRVVIRNRRFLQQVGPCSDRPVISQTISPINNTTSTSANSRSTLLHNEPIMHCSVPMQSNNTPASGGSGETPTAVTTPSAEQTNSEFGHNVRLPAPLRRLQNFNRSGLKESPIHNVRLSNPPDRL